MTLYEDALQAARDEFDRERVPLGAEMWPEADTYWALVSEKAAALCREIDTSEFAEMLGVSLRRAQAIIASGAVESRKLGKRVVVPLLRAREYANRERRPGRPRKQQLRGKVKA